MDSVEGARRHLHVGARRHGAPELPPSSAAAVLDAMRKQPRFSALGIIDDDSLQRASIFDGVRKEQKAQVLADGEAAEDPTVQRAVGCMVGMAIADSIGHNFEFMPAQDKRDSRGPDGPWCEYGGDAPPGGRCVNAFNQFQLKPGQWTDDASMGLCMSDSILMRGELDGSDIRVWFWNWWFNGLDNAFRKDEARENIYHGDSLSVGLGGNISKSLMELERGFKNCQRDKVPPHFNSPTEDAGNGSLMRLAPVPIRYRCNLLEACGQAYESSFTTHPGPMAAEACAFMSYMVASALQRREGDGGRSTLIAAFLDATVAAYLEFSAAEAFIARLGPDNPARGELRRLLKVEAEAPTSTERCWSWRESELGLEATLAARGRTYNGYPVSAGYFGAFSFDGLAMALHCAYHTSNFNDAIVKCINFAGDADTTGAICGQIVGAFYGAREIDATWIGWLHKWDEREVELRALLLHAEGEPRAAAAAPGSAPEPEA